MTARRDGRSEACPHRHRQAGSVTLVALGLAAIVLVVGIVAVDIALLVVARARAQTAADLAALAALAPSATGWEAGEPSPDGSAPVAAAEAVVAANGAELVACACGANEAVVTVRERVHLLPAGTTLSASARARAVLPGLDGRAQSTGRP
jgi:secretion/DNA translocation related TadE-like protein